MTSTIPNTMEDVHAILASRARTRLASISPKELTHAETLIARAQAAVDHAQSGLNQRKAVIRELEAQIIQLGEHRELVAQFSAEFSFDTEATSASNVFDAWQISITNHCPQTVNAYVNLLNQATVACAIRPHVASRLATLKATETAMVDGILQTAITEKIDLDNLLRVMSGEAGRQPSGRLGDDHRHRLFANGLLNISRN